MVMGCANTSYLNAELNSQERIDLREAFIRDEAEKHVFGHMLTMTEVRFEGFMSNGETLESESAVLSSDLYEKVKYYYRNKYHNKIGDKTEAELEIAKSFLVYLEKHAFWLEYNNLNAEVDA